MSYYSRRPRPNVPMPEQVTTADGLTLVYLERSQHSHGSSAHMFGGPDRYGVLLVVPAGAEVPGVLREDLLERRGIRRIGLWEGYSQHTGPRSAMGQARIAAATRMRQALLLACEDCGRALSTPEGYYGPRCECGIGEGGGPDQED